MIASIMILAIMTTLFYQTHTTTFVAQNDLPDSYMEQVTAIIINKQGNPTLKIETPRMLHFSKNNTSELIDPQLTIYRQSPEPWLIAAKYARALNGIQHVVFWEDVVLQHAADNKNPPTVIKTPKLTLYPLDQKANTDEFITMIQPNIIIRATGMSADLNAGNVKLLKEARGEYVPDA